jgi:hypothetical protein
MHRSARRGGSQREPFHPTIPPLDAPALSQRLKGVFLPCIFG